MKSLILDKTALNQKITRLAYEIVEDQYDEKEICLVGIQKGGLQVAKILQEEIAKIYKGTLSVNSIEVNKSNPLASEDVLSESISYFDGKAIIIVDDVANSGKTIFYSFRKFLGIKPSNIKVAVLVDRKHKRFPVHCDYVGTSLATTIKEHIEVVFEKNEVEAAYLV